jgi:cytochrome c peroxidase
MRTKGPRTRSTLRATALAIPLLLVGCGEMQDDATADESFLAGDAFTNPTGASRVVTVNGAAIDENNPFFQNLGVNGRRCVTCHQPSAAMGITPSQVQALFNASQGLDPLFRLNDGANGPLAKVGTLAERSAAYSLLRTKGLIRIGLTLPASRDFDVKVVLDPYAGTGANPPVNQTVPATASPMLSFYRRPLLSANTRFISAVMWDGREATVSPVPNNLTEPAFPNNNPPEPWPGRQAFEPDAPVRINMLTQSNNATLGHAEGVDVLSDAVRAQLVDFQMNLVVAQERDNVAGALNLSGAIGGPQALRTQQTFFGINDSHGGNPFGTAFNPNAMTLFNAWAGLSGTTQNNRRASIARGQAIFNTKLIRISGVRGVNDALGVATLNGSCTTCHTHPNVGNHTDILPLDLGISKAAEGDNVLPVFRVTNRATGASEEVTDLGRAILTGRFADLGKQKGPTLRALSARAPYFHNGAADNLTELIQFYDRRFGIGFQAQEIADLRAFLEAL